MAEVTPELVRRLLEAAITWPWHNRGDVIAYESGRILINLCEAPDRTADAELLAAAPDIAAAYLQVCEERERLRAAHFVLINDYRLALARIEALGGSDV